MKALANDAPQFALFQHKLDIVRPEDIEPGELFITFTGDCWCANIMTQSRVPRILGRHFTFQACYFHATK